MQKKKKRQFIWLTKFNSAVLNTVKKKKSEDDESESDDD